jgi:hypothetical protein
MGKGRSKDKYFGDGAMTYIEQKAAELLTNLPVNGPYEGITAMEWGVAQEPEAVAEFEKRYNVKVEYFGKANPLFFPWGEYAGGSPDAMIDSTTGIEIKCPYNSGEHLRHLLLDSANELALDIPKYYWQCIANMLFTGAKHWIFLSYDPRFPIAEYQMKILDIPYHSDHIEELKERIARAEQVLGDIVQRLMKNTNYELQTTLNS